MNLGRTPIGRISPITLPCSSTPSRTNLKISCIRMISPSMPVISATEVTRRLPSCRRSSWHTTLMAEAIWARADFGLMSMPDMPIICSRRDRASRGVLACRVVIEPSWPVFIACSMSKASPERISPRMTRSGRMRSAFFTRSRWLTSPRPSMLDGRVSRRTTWLCCNCSSAESSIVTTRSWLPIDADSALSMVVLPEPVPPETITLRRLATTAFSIVAQSTVIEPYSTSLSMLVRLGGNLRMERHGPSMASGGMIALMRLPSGRRASTIGELSSTRRPTFETILPMMRSRC